MDDLMIIVIMEWMVFFFVICSLFGWYIFWNFLEVIIISIKVVVMVRLVLKNLKIL